MTDFWPCGQKLNRGYLLVMTSYWVIVTVKVVCSNFMKKLSQILPNNICINFTYHNQANLLYYIRPWNVYNRLVMNDHHIKFEVPRPKRSPVIDRKPFLPSRSMWPWPIWPWPPKINRVIYWSWTIIIPSLKFLDLNVL
jgi:hypothetical protein